MEKDIALFLTQRLLEKNNAVATIERGPVTCSVVKDKHDPKVEIWGFYVHAGYLNQGFGGEVLKEILAWADSHQLTVGLSACPFDKAYGGMDMDALVAFYQRHGFEIVGQSEVMGKRLMQLIHMIRPRKR